MEIIELELKDIHPYANNPRHNDDTVDYVANSIREFGFKVPLVIDKDYNIVTGHTRYKACKQLGMKTIPCVIADDLTDEQIKAFRLADNKVSEYSTWDFGLLDMELESLDLDMESFGFEINLPEELLEEREEKENERVRTNEAYNLDIYDDLDTDGFYQMPVIYNDGVIPDDMIGFNYAKTSTDKDVGIHMYIDDYQFERLWNKPQDYVDILKEYQCVFSPDFSLYMDMPMAMKVWNIYRSRLIGQYLQRQGVKVIPTISWAESETFTFCFDGIPVKSIVSVSTIGVKRDSYAMEIWKSGMDAMIEKIKPSMILVYGGELDYNYQDIPVKYYENKVTERLKELKEVV